jgi:hypothetical protein
MRLITAVVIVMHAALPASAVAAASSSKLTPNQKFAACVVSADSTGSDTLVRSEPGTEDETRLTAALADMIKRCDRKVPSNSQMPSKAMFRGMLAERLWLNRVSMFFAAPGPENDPSRINYDVGFDATPYRDNYRLAFCVADTKPSLVDQLVRTGIGSPEELAAFNALNAGIAHCLPLGRSVSLDREWLRATLIEQLYRRYPSASVPRSRSSMILNNE